MVSDHGFAATGNAALGSSCVPDAIAASATVAWLVAGQRGCVKDVAPTAATSRAPKADSTIAIASGAIAAVKGKRA